MDPTTQDLLTIVPAGVAVALATALVIWGLIRSSMARLLPPAMLLVAFCLEIYFIRQPGIQIGLQIYPNDVVSLFVLFATLASFVKRPMPVHAMPFLLWLAFGISIMTSLAVGIQAFGRFAGTEARPFFYLWVSGLYFCTTEFTEAELRRIARWCLWTAYVLIGIAAYYWVAVEVGLIDRKGLLDADDDTYVFRPVPAHAALFIGMVGLLQTMAWLRGTGTRLSGLHAALLLAFVVIIQHRSAWVATSIALSLILVYERRHLPRRFALVLAFGLSLAFVLAIAGAAGALDDLTRRLIESARSMSDTSGTFSARVDGWIRLMEAWWSAPITTQLFGYPFGTGYTRQYRGVIIEWAPHNFYVDLLLRVGIVGAIFFLIPTAMAAAYGLRARCSTEFEYLFKRGLGIMLFSVMIYTIVYPTNYILTGATGLLLAELIRHGQRRDRGAVSAAPTRNDVVARPMNWRTDR